LKIRSILFRKHKLCISTPANSRASFADHSAKQRRERHAKLACFDNAHSVERKNNEDVGSAAGIVFMPFPANRWD